METNKPEMNDRDMLIRIDANLSNLLETFKQHILDDKVSFNQQDTRIKNLEKAYWIGIGIIVVLNIFFKVIIK